MGVSGGSQNGSGNNQVKRDAALTFATDGGFGSRKLRLRSIFALALSEGAIDGNPATTLFTPWQFKAEGMRPGEILALQLGDLEGDSVWVRRSFTDRVFCS
jgi:integrase